VFDKGEKDDLEKGVVYKERKDKGGDSKKKDSRTVKAIAYHVKNLKDPDPEVRQSSAEMLGILMAATAVPDLIDVLRPGREDKIMVLLSANGALVRITQKNFGYKITKSGIRGGFATARNSWRRLRPAPTKADS